jgi:hypothetical protein
MLSGTPRFTCRSGVGLLICFIFISSLSVASAQQASGQNGPPRSKGASRSATGHSGERIGSGRERPAGGQRHADCSTTLALAGGPNYTAKMSGARAHS